jgi:hypothetical protein
VKFAEALLKGEPDRIEIIKDVVLDKVRESSRLRFMIEERGEWEMKKPPVVTPTAPASSSPVVSSESYKF